MSYYKHSDNFWQQQRVYDNMNGVTRPYPGGPSRPKYVAPSKPETVHEAREVFRVQEAKEPYKIHRKASQRLLGKTWLYRYFSEGGSLLYVGITCDKTGRHKAHGKQSQWFYLHARIDYTEYEIRTEAEAAEIVAIREERPQWNIMHNAKR